MCSSSFYIGTRGSALAIAQTTSVIRLLEGAYPGLCIEQKIISTLGDASPNMAIHLPTAEASGLFTRQLEEALLSHEIDMAVHSLKDLPIITPPGLRLSAILPRASTSDVLITLEPQRVGVELSTLPPQAIIGTSSPRRSEILRHARPDLSFVCIRGNVPTRLRKLAMDQCEYRLDALVLARAGLERLGYDLRISAGRGDFVFERTKLYVTELTTMLPAPGQGAIVIETRAEEALSSAAAYVAVIHHEKTALCVSAERLLLQYLGGGCHMALGALATLDEISQRIHLKAIYFPFEGATPRKGEASGATPEEAALLVAIELGEKLALIS